MRARHRIEVARLIAPMAAFWQRFFTAFLVMMAMALLMLGKVDAVAVQKLRVLAVDGIGPVVAAVTQPVASVARLVDQAQKLWTLAEENDRLRAENERLRTWYDMALRLEVENRSLRTLLDYRGDVATRGVATRVIADVSGPFLQSLLLPVGQRDGIAVGDAVLAGGSMAGRIVLAGVSTSRSLLITDLNSRVPVVVERTRHRGVVAGNNSPQLELLHLPRGATVQVGDRLVTSGHGGVLPPGLPVARVIVAQPGAIRLEPLVDLARLDHVQVLHASRPDEASPAAAHDDVSREGLLATDMAASSILGR